MIVGKRCINMVLVEKNGINGIKRHGSEDATIGATTKSQKSDL